MLDVIQSRDPEFMFGASGNLPTFVVVFVLGSKCTRPLKFVSNCIVTAGDTLSSDAEYIWVSSRSSICLVRVFFMVLCMVDRWKPFYSLHFREWYCHATVEKIAVQTI
ncbi:hypothetical protein Y032_0652g1162 [Ancylostoma ceylanicum]|nr:hypothetical protein Y032_0652g1162 [Ancylostoma ceylanicum]